MSLRPRSGELAEEEYQRQVAEARSRQLSVSVERVTSPRKEGGGLPRATDRRAVAREEQIRREQERKEAERKTVVQESLSHLPPCPVCDKPFSSKSNLVKHIKSVQFY